MDFKIKQTYYKEAICWPIDFNEQTSNNIRCLKYTLSLFGKTSKRIGYISFTIIPCKIAKIGNEIVSEQYHGFGLGKKLYLEAEKIIQSHCIPKIIADSFDEAVGFWEKMGFFISDFESNLIPIEKRL